MSRENVELVHRAFETFAAEGIEAALPFFSPGCVWYATDRWLDDSAYRGHDGMRRLDAEFSDNFDDWGYEVEDVRDAGDRVVALSQMTGRIKDSGASVGQPIGLVVSDFRAGTFGEVRAFATWDEALEAVGLRE